jgi:hypothetical protein
MTAIFDSGNFAIAGWADQPTLTPVAPSGYVAGQLGSLKAPFNPDLQPVNILSGSLNQSVAIVPRKGSGTWQIAADFFPTLNFPFLAEHGIAAVITAPKQFTLTASMKAGAYQYPGCFANSIRIQGDAANGGMISYGGIYTARPVPVAALSAPSLTGEDPYTWEDFKQVTLVTGASSVSDVEAMDISIALPRGLGYGNSGVALPNISALNGCYITGTITLYMNDTNVAEYNAGIASDGTAGSLVFIFDKVLTGTKKTTFTLPHVKYTTPQLDYPKDGIDLITLGFSSFSPTLANQMTMVQVTN